MAEVRVRQNQIDIDQSGQLTDSEWNAWRGSNKQAAGQTVVITSNDGSQKLLTKNFDEAISGGQVEIPSSGDALPPLSPADALVQKMDELLNRVKNAEASGDVAEANQLKQQLAGLIAEARSQGITTAKYEKAAGMSSADNSALGEGMSLKASVNSPGTPSPTQTMGGAAAMNGGNAGPSSFYPPSGWGAQTWSGPQFDSSAYMQSIQVTDNIMSSYDEIGKSQSRGRQLMMLFFYFAKMAESGDMGAMYQFMKFITYVITKDKAKQQIEVGKKLIELQELSRQWTGKLLDLKTSSTDPNSSNELMKTMTLVKSETDAIATSQKLMGQMMEEFAQITETLTNVTKSTLETAGRIQRTVSRFNA